jgi:hypothetical protein
VVGESDGPEGWESCKLQVGVGVCGLWRCRRNTGVLHCVQDDGSCGVIDDGSCGAIDDGVLGLRLFVEVADGLVDFGGAARRGYIGVGFGDGGPGFFADVLNDLGGVLEDIESVGVGRRQAETFIEGVGALLGDAAGGESVDDGGDGELDGGAVLERGQLEEGVVSDEAGLEVDLVAEEVVAAVQALVEVTKD